MLRSRTFAVMSGVDRLIDRSDAALRANVLLGGEALGDSFVNGVVQISQLSAMFIVVRPFVGRQWRRAGIVTIVLLILAQVVVSAELPVDLFLALPLGAAIGTAVLLVFGRPDRHPTLAGIATALDNAGLPVSEVRPAKVDARGSTPYFATLEDGTGLFVKVLGGPGAGRRICCSACTGSSDSRTSVTTARSRRCGARSSTRRWWP